MNSRAKNADLVHFNVRRDIDNRVDTSLRLSRDIVETKRIELSTPALQNWSDGVVEVRHTVLARNLGRGVVAACTADCAVGYSLAAWNDRCK